MARLGPLDGVANEAMKACSLTQCDNEPMTQEEFGPDSDYESGTGNYDAPNGRRAVAAFERELESQRANQDGYVADVRSRSIGLLTVVSGALLIVAAFAELSDIHQVAVALALIGVVVMVFATIQVQRPRDGFFAGPVLGAEIAHARKEGELDVNVRWNLAEWTAENVERNDAKGGPIRSMQWWLMVELVAAAAIVIIVVLGLSTVGGDAKGTDPEPAKPVTTTATE